MKVLSTLITSQLEFMLLNNVTYDSRSRFNMVEGTTYLQLKDS